MRKPIKDPVQLSEKSLARVFNWVEENMETPLAQAYINACLSCGELDRRKIAEQLGKTFPPIKSEHTNFDHLYGSKAYSAAQNIEDWAWRYKDTVGRVIFDMLKRESKGL